MKSNVSRRLIYVVGSITFAYFVITLALPSRSLGDGTTCGDQDGSTLPATLPTDSGEFSKTLVAEFHFQSDSAYRELVLGRLNQAKRSCNECLRTAALLVPDGHWRKQHVNDMLTLIEDVQKLSPNQQVQFRQMLRSYRAAEISLSERKLKEGLQYGIEAKQCMELLGLDGSPLFTSNLVTISEAYRAMRNYQAEVETLTALLGPNPKFGPLWISRRVFLGAALMKTEHFFSAESVLRDAYVDAMRIPPNELVLVKAPTIMYVSPRLTYAIFLSQVGEHQAAEIILNEVLSCSAVDLSAMHALRSQCQLELAGCFMGRGDLKSAAAYAQQADLALRQIPSHVALGAPVLRFSGLIGETLILCGERQSGETRLDEAIRRLELIPLEEAPHRARPNAWLGLLENSKGRTAESERFFDEWTQHYSSQPDAHMPYNIRYLEQAIDVKRKLGKNSDILQNGLAACRARLAEEKKKIFAAWEQANFHPGKGK